MMEYRIVGTGEQCEVEYVGPFAVESWTSVSDQGSREYCEYVIASLSEGEQPANYDDWQGRQEDAA